MKKRILSMALIICLIFTMLPAMAFAQDETADPETVVEEQTEEKLSTEETIEDTQETDEEELVEEELEEVNAAGDYHIVYNGHVQGIGWMDLVQDGGVAGTFGEARRVEAITVAFAKEGTAGSSIEDYEILKDAIEYRAHVQTYAWLDWVKDGQEAGTTGQAKRVEAFSIKLKEPYASMFDIYYCVHAQRYGWLGWAKNGADAGTAGYALRLEALKIQLVTKGSPAPAPIGETPRAFLSDDLMGMVNYKTHVQTYGWQSTVADGATAGTSGEGKRMEAFQVWIDNPDGLEGSVEYTAHVQTYGWQEPWKSSKQTAGTSGEAKRVEAIKIRLTGELADKYSIYYRVHCQTFGTLGWAKDGEPAGSEGFAKRLENMEIIMVEKTDTEKIAELEGSGRAFVGASCMPELKGASYADADGAWTADVKGNLISLGSQGLSKELQGLKLDIDNGGDSMKYSGSLQYKVLTEDGWSEAASSYDPAGVPDSGKMIQAIQISLTGEAAQFCDVYYRAYCQRYGWLGWAKSGQSAGTEDYDLRMESLEVTLVAKNNDAPGSTSGAFLKFNPAFNDMTNRVQGMTSGTGYLIAVDCKNNLCGVFTGSTGNWKLLHAWTCTTGAPATPTCKGQYSIIYKKPYFGDTYTAWYASFFQASGYAFHSVLYLPGSKTQFRDPRLGMALSHGCVRLAIENAQWIYNNCGGGTRVYTYK